MYLINALCDIVRPLVVGAHHIACALEQFGALELGPLSWSWSWSCWAELGQDIAKAGNGLEGSGND